MPDAAKGETNSPEVIEDERLGTNRRRNPMRATLSSAAFIVAGGEGRAAADRHSGAPVDSDGSLVRNDEARGRISGEIRRKAAVHEPWKGKTQGSIRRSSC
jgi:hypothetical protein